MKDEIFEIVEAQATATGVIGEAVDKRVRSFTLQLAGTFVGSVTVEESNNNVDFYPIGMFDADHSTFAAGGGVFSSLTSPNIVYGIVRGRYVRVRVSAYTSGTIGIHCLFWGDETNLTATRAIMPASATSSPTKLEDAVHGSGDMGMFLLAVRNDTIVNRTSATGDYSPISVDNLARIIATMAPRAARTRNNITLTDTTETTLIASGSGIFRDLTFLSISNTSATGVRVDIRDATGGTVRLSYWVPAGDTKIIDFGGIPYKQTSQTQNWTAQLSASVTDVRIAAMAIDEG